MHDWLKEWHVKYAIGVWYLIIGVLVWNYFPSKFPDFQEQISWMESHEKLSGWAQFYGATLALVAAILVPAWQRYLQSLDKKRGDAEANLANALGVFYLISEVRNHMEGYLEKKDMPREISRENEVRRDLLARIHALELRDTDQERLTLLFRVRGFVHQTDQALAAPWLQKVPLNAGEHVLISKRLIECRQFLARASEIKDEALFHNARIRQWWMVRRMFPIAVLLLKWRQRANNSEKVTKRPDYRPHTHSIVHVSFKRK